jgi:hypothetical protein
MRRKQDLPVDGCFGSNPANQGGGRECLVLPKADIRHGVPQWRAFANMRHCHKGSESVRFMHQSLPVDPRLGTNESGGPKTAASKFIKICFVILRLASKQEGAAWGPLAVIDDALSRS